MDGKVSNGNPTFTFWSAFFFSRDLVSDHIFNSEQAMKLLHEVIFFDHFSSYKYTNGVIQNSVSFFSL